MKEKIRFPFDSDGGLNIEQNLKDFMSCQMTMCVNECVRSVVVIEMMVAMVDTHTE